MVQKQEIFSFSSAFLLMVVLINVLIIKTAYIYDRDFYWALLFSLALLAFAIYYKRTVSKKEAKHTKINGNGRGFNKADNVALSRRTDGKELNVLIGNSHCAQPCLSSLICVDTVTANQNSNYDHNGSILNNVNNFSEDTGIKSGTESYVIWQVTPGYPGCSDHNFYFNPELFKSGANNLKVKMVELNLITQVNRHKVSTTRNIDSQAVINNKDPHIILKPITKHTAFGNAESMAIFLDTLRHLSGKKPVGIRLCIADKKTFHEICYAFCKTEIIPDYIVIEDCSVENNLCLPFYDALLFASKTLETYGLAKGVKIIAATEIGAPLDVLKLVALGADAIRLNNNFLTDKKNKKLTNIQATAFSGHYNQLRNEILRSTIDLMNSFGYMHLKDITLSSLLHKLDNVQPVNTDVDDQQFRDADQKKSFRIIKKVSPEPTRHTVISFN